MLRTRPRSAAAGLSILALLAGGCAGPRVVTREIPRPTERAAETVLGICGGETIRGQDLDFCYWIRALENDQGWSQ
jgi:hypothetical protein